MAAHARYEAEHDRGPVSASPSGPAHMPRNWLLCSRPAAPRLAPPPRCAWFLFARGQASQRKHQEEPAPCGLALSLRSASRLCLPWTMISPQPLPSQERGRGQKGSRLRGKVDRSALEASKALISSRACAGTDGPQLKAVGWSTPCDRARSSGHTLHHRTGHETGPERESRVLEVAGMRVLNGKLRTAANKHLHPKRLAAFLPRFQLCSPMTTLSS